MVILICCCSINLKPTLDLIKRSFAPYFWLCCHSNLCTVHPSLVESSHKLVVAASSPLVLILLHSVTRQAPTLEYPAYCWFSAEARGLQGKTGTADSDTQVRAGHDQQVIGCATDRSEPVLPQGPTAQFVHAFFEGKKGCSSSRTEGATSRVPSVCSH